MTGQKTKSSTMNQIVTLLNQARNARLDKCDGCQRSPRLPANKGSNFFPIQCAEHYPGRKPKVLFVFRDPGSQGSRESRKLCDQCNSDRTAFKMRELLDQNGIKREKIYLTNAVLHGIRGKDKAPTRAVARACSGVLGLMIGILRPRLVVTFGTEALRAVDDVGGKRDRRSLGKRVGKLAMVGGIALLPMYHPSPWNFGTNKLGRKIENHWKTLAGEMRKMKI